jgi:hypothetical protein
MLKKFLCLTAFAALSFMNVSANDKVREPEASFMMIEDKEVTPGALICDKSEDKCEASKPSETPLAGCCKGKLPKKTVRVKASSLLACKDCN